ncbi:acylaldehyde oxidase (plasmid) [Sinorhizobium meliloti]|uniref:xanthine dehydrogenase family protein molybdopterin-binding subunit n=1 Tax=Rhizobium meliloti TaxID=382 RepID=UPI000B499E49|nr:xanthine dehydrogenase family protein molybdopterin-binding subunit [Sinorhizobium meliloti]ASP74402.1 acylaldehyde oxidase [Sinorhizobium meliloti]MDE3857493.1 xanthine dehydrogenase family protein molybdopterin-binding subunit [Sinorhizobium meliloti]MQW49623.1 molybdopterin-dependent oxidoreductase [Sinorhizobium meliloti]MQW49674.1 molybdopterin-dependent oxidoreductase [Sinorhizobium meliloti]
MTTAVIGKPISRVDGRAKVIGSATYAAEFDQPNQAYAAVVRSTVAAGRITSIETAEAEQAPGIVAVLTHRNAPKLAYAPHKGFTDPAIGERLHVLQDDRVNHQGHPIALVVADTLEQANHAATLLRVTYAPETAATDIDAGEPVLPTQQKTDQATTQPPETRRGDPAGALASAEVKVEQTYVIPRENHNPIEMHATVAAWNGDRLTLWDKSQYVYGVAEEIAAVFGIRAENVRVVSPFVGGAFGSGLRAWSHVTLAALGARVAGRPVKLMLSRREMYYGTGFRPHTVQRVALGASRDGRLTAILHDGYEETSTYEEFAEALLDATRILHSCPNVYTRHRLVPMNVHTPIWMRAPGEASGVFALECALDELAVALDIDPVELRLRNEPEQDEFKSLPFSSRSTRECYRVAAERFGWSRRTPKPRSMRDGRWLIGWGMATATYPVNFAPASAMARLLPDGTAEVTSAASDMGPGTWTSMTQVAADTLGLPIERVKFSLGDTRMPRTPPHGGSMTMASVGSAVQAACRKAREDALARGGANDLVGAMARLGQPVEATADSTPGDAGQRFSMHSFGAVFTEVAVDPDLGETRVRRIVGAYGAGRIVNPKTARSQCVGGMIGGMGMALMEHSVVDPRNGRVTNANLAEYAVPVHADAPPVMDVIFVDEKDPHVNPLGVKGLGEIALVGVAPAIGNAVYHATGKRLRELPITPDKLL